MHDCISSNPLCFFDFRGLFLHFLLEYPPNFSPKFFGYTPKLFGYPIKIWMHSNFFSKPHIQIYLINGVLLGTRTLDPLIKSQLLYQLS